jgi:hypothetical protein
VSVERGGDPGEGGDAVARSPAFLEPGDDRLTHPSGPTFTFYDFDQINQAAADAESGATVKPILRVT